MHRLNKNIISYKKPTSLNTKNYSSNYTQEFINKDIFDSILKDFHLLLSKVLKNGNKQASFDPNEPIPVLSLGGGGSGDSLQKMRKLFSGKASLQLLLDELNSQKFCDYIFSNLNMKRHILVQPNQKYRLRDFIFRKRPCYLNLRLTAYPTNSGIAYHRDNPRKLVAMLLYLGFSDYKVRNIAGTQFYSDISPNQSFSKSFSRHDWDHIVAPESLTLVHDQHPIANNFVAFECNRFSWHRVKKVELDKNICRYNFQINFQIPKFTIPLKIVYRLICLLPISCPERFMYG